MDSVIKVLPKYNTVALNWKSFLILISGSYYQSNLELKWQKLKGISSKSST